MSKEEIDPQEEIKFCIEAMKCYGLPINLNSLLFGTVDDDYTYFDVLAHDMTDKLLGDELTDDEIMTTIKRFTEYSEAQHG